jgi:hypothetical protein
MKKEDIVGRQIVCFKFPGDSVLSYSTQAKYEGKLATVRSIHARQPKYSMVEYEDGNTDYYPTDMIVEHLEYADRSVDDVIKELHGLFRKIYS